MGWTRETMVFTPLEFDAAEKYPLVKEKLESMPGIQMVTSVNQDPLQVSTSTGDPDWDGKDPNSSILFHILQVSHDYLNAMKN